MPKLKNLQKILLIGSGPIVIGQACEFDYSGSQACKALKEEGYQVVLINSNPATIMTDPELADRTYVEPITPEVVTKIIAQERPDALLPTMGGQTGLNVAFQLAREGVLDHYGVEILGAGYDSIRKAEDRELFRQAMEEIGADILPSCRVCSVQEAVAFVEEIGFPVIIRPSYTLGGAGGGVAHDMDGLQDIVSRGLRLSAINEVLIEESALGWKEIELELMRDKADNVIVVCSIENFDPMGIHTGDSITVAPAQTLTDKEYQKMRDLGLKIIRAIGVEAGGANIQFALNPDDGRIAVIELNPRVSRSSALASKATGFPIAKIAAKLAVGYTLDELPNDITRTTPASFEPAIDYVVVKVPRWDFSKFPGTDQHLTTYMKSVGEVMAIGRNFKEALQKALRSLDEPKYLLGSKEPQQVMGTPAQICQKSAAPVPERILYLYQAFKAGLGLDELYGATGIDKWFLYNIQQIAVLEEKIKTLVPTESPAHLPSHAVDIIRQAKEYGFSDEQLANFFGLSQLQVRGMRLALGVTPVFKAVDTCAGEFEANTPYFYSTYDFENEVPPSDRKRIMILGSGPNRIGQGIEFDYACVHAAQALREEGYEVIMVNCNPETVSTDYDTSDRLYFEPLTLEDVLNIYDLEKADGVIVQFGGQTPLKLAKELEEYGIPIIGTSPSNIDLAEDREKMAQLLARLDILQPPGGSARSWEEALLIARKIGYPVLVRPSYVLGGQAMQVVFKESDLVRYMERAVQVSPTYPVLIDKFLSGALEIDVDALCDGDTVHIGGIMEHIEGAGIHSGDSACFLPSLHLSRKEIGAIKTVTEQLALELEVIGLLNLQFAVQDGRVYLLEANPRASRTVPFVSKATGIPLAKLATRVMVGEKLAGLDLGSPLPKHVAVKEAVLPFARFPGVDIILGPEMRSTGEVMGMGSNFGLAFAKSQMAAGCPLPLSGSVLLSVADSDKKDLPALAQLLKDLGFNLLATQGTASYLQEKGYPVEIVRKINEGSPHVGHMIQDDKIHWVINTPNSQGPEHEEYLLRRLALEKSLPIMTTISAALAAAEGIKYLQEKGLEVKCLQDYFSVSS